MHKTKRIKTPTCALLTVNNKVFNWGVTSILNTKNFFLFCKTKNHSTIQQENTMLNSSALTVLFHRDMRVSCKYEKRGRVNIRNPSLILCNQSFNLSPILLHSILNVNVVGLNYSLFSPSLSSNSDFKNSSIYHKESVKCYVCMSFLGLFYKHEICYTFINTSCFG